MTMTFHRVILLELATVKIIILFCSRIQGTNVFIKPEITNVILNTQVTLECYTYDGEYNGLNFGFTTPPEASANWEVSPVTNLTGGGIKISTSIVITRELNGTVAVCYAAGPKKFGNSRAATLIAQEVPNRLDGIRVCKLSRRVFFSWNNVPTLNGIDVRYGICDNCKRNEMIDVPHYSIHLDELGSGPYLANITVILLAPAANQVVNGKPYLLERHITDERSLNLSKTEAYKNSTVVNFHFDLKLDDLNDDCNFNNFTDRKWIVCNDDTGCNNLNAFIEYRGQKLTSMAELNTLRHRFESRLSFYYLGENIETENVTTSTHDVQEIKMINPSCFSVGIIDGSEISSFRIQIASSEGEVYNLNVLRQNVSTILCSPIAYNGTLNISFSEKFGIYSIHVYDDQTEEEDQQPAAEVNNLSVKLVMTTEPISSSEPVPSLGPAPSLEPAPSSSCRNVVQLVYFLVVHAVLFLIFM